ncbi:MAG: divalent cation tolerance protein CutA [Saprospiraceae bacterium]
MKNKIILFYIPCANKAEASKLAKASLQEKLSSCANIYPIDSSFSFKDKLENVKENILLLKTLPSLAKKLKKLIKTNHSYEIPCILSYKVKVNKPYKLWMKEILNKPNI